MDCSKLLSKYNIDKQRMCGDTYESLEWYDDTNPKPTEEELELLNKQLIVDEMREKRNELLKDRDYIALPDFPHKD
jgi:hypothetical protein